MPPDQGKSPSSPQNPPSTQTNTRPESSDDDFDEEEGIDRPANDGYELLSSSVAEILETTDEDEPSDQIERHRVMDHITEHMIPSRALEMDDESATDPSESCQTFHLSKDDSEKIKSVMSGIKLPASAIPEWAQVVPEENWKTLLHQKIKDKIVTSHEDH